MSRKREIERLLRRLRRSERPVRVRWQVILTAGLGLLVGGVFLLTQSDGGPVRLPRQGPEALARQRADFAVELRRSLTPFQRSTLDRLEPVLITGRGFTREQRERAWRLAEVGGAQFPLRDVSAITARLEQGPNAAGAMSDEVHCLVRVEFASQGSAVSYSGIAGPAL